MGENVAGLEHIRRFAGGQHRGPCYQIGNEFQIPIRDAWNDLVGPLLIDLLVHNAVDPLAIIDVVSEAAIRPKTVRP